MYVSGLIAGIRSYRNGQGYASGPSLRQQRELITRDQSLFLLSDFLFAQNYRHNSYLPSFNLLSRNCRHNSYHLRMSWRTTSSTNTFLTQFTDISYVVCSD